MSAKEAESGHGVNHVNKEEIATESHTLPQTRVGNFFNTTNAEFVFRKIFVFQRDPLQPFQTEICQA